MKGDGPRSERRHASNRPCREYLRRRGVGHTIPEKIDSQAARLCKGAQHSLSGFSHDRPDKS